MVFAGGSDIRFTQEMVPAAVPEPRLLGLIGSLALCALALKNAKKPHAPWVCLRPESINLNEKIYAAGQIQFRKG
jgi:hypothetical protein